MMSINVDWFARSTALRSAMRRLGVTRFVSGVRSRFFTKEYEQRVDEALSACIQRGDCVWDVGANVGIYTERFAAQVGQSGRVVAFEPIETTYRALTSRISGARQVTALHCALGAAQATVHVVPDADPTSPTNSLAGQVQSNPNAVPVRVEAGDLLITSGAAPQPNVIKIDTEGFEEEVLWGLRECLQNKALRALLIEVHFALLEGRGRRRAPDRIASTLRDAGFELRWVDASHLLATRRG